MNLSNSSSFYEVADVLSGDSGERNYVSPCDDDEEPNWILRDSDVSEGLVIRSALTADLQLQLVIFLS